MKILKKTHEKAEISVKHFYVFYFIVDSTSNVVKLSHRDDLENVSSKMKTFNCSTILVNKLLFVVRYFKGVYRDYKQCDTRRIRP